MTNRITIREVAKEANVSIATVSKALNGVDVVRPATKERVMAAAQRLHYVPNLMGKQLKNTKTKMLGFYTTSIKGPYFSVLVEAIAREAEKHGYAVNVFLSADKRVVLNSILGGVVDGIIGFEDFLTKQDLAAMEREQIKAVFIDRNIQEKNFGSVVFDSFEKGKAATEYLLSLGHKKIAFISGITGVYDSDERLRGYLEALNEAGVSKRSDYQLQGFFEEERTRVRVQQFLLEQKDLPTAFLAGNDLSAIGTVKAIHETKWRVPDDFSVIGFDGIDLLDYFMPRLTTVKNPIQLQGVTAVNHLIKMIEENACGVSYVLPGELSIKQSTKQVNE
ncbi:LacI family DNA-binding transcriptional regulator [Enterococcus sp. AZ154]|uniref:LacI family DNA-binding transcriptional regulator n=1 Tax=Enterococcus sp. AZ154 TaxID=2774683 RepID=UPI003D2E4541